MFWSWDIIRPTIRHFFTNYHWVSFIFWALKDFVSFNSHELTFTLNMTNYHSTQIVFPFHRPKAHIATCNNYLQIMVCSCAMSFSCVWLLFGITVWQQIIFCSLRKQNLSSPYCDRSCANNGRSLRSPKIFIENKLCDRMIKQLLDEVEQHIEICQWRADQLFAEAFWYVYRKNPAFILSFSWCQTSIRGTPQFSRW